MSTEIDRRDREIAKLTEMLLQSRKSAPAASAINGDEKKLDEILKRLAEIEEVLKQQRNKVSMTEVAPNKAVSEPLFAKMSDLEILSTTEGVDKDWYVKNYPDIKRSGVDPAEHYINHGAAEGRNPRSDFNTVEYYLKYPKLKQTNENPLVHYIKNLHQESNK